ncbi:hypothetical protein [Streptomyces sp. NPDC058157]|uniref:hypothetical protein n=1 Tax=Streptomyces sp. NPDC058157 TaxID=3346360 RepID=UPI0036EF5BC2
MPKEFDRLVDASISGSARSRLLERIGRIMEEELAGQGAGAQDPPNDHLVEQGVTAGSHRGELVERVLKRLERELAGESAPDPH